MKRGEGSLRQVRGIFYIDRAPERGFRPHGERMGAMDTDQITVPNDSPVLIGLRIRDARMQRHLKPEVLAGQLGISKAHLCNIEYGRKVPSLELIISVAHALAVSLDYLLLGMERVDRPLPDEIQMHSDEFLLSRCLYVRKGKIPWDGL